MLQHIDLEEFQTRTGEDTHFTSNWGGWTTLSRNPIQDYENVRKAFATKSVHEEDFLLFGRLGSNPGLFVDVGANMGFSAISFRNVNRSLHILSFEAVPFIAPVLALVARDVADFDFRMVGISDRDQESILYIPVFKHLMCTPLASFSIPNFEQDHRQAGWRQDTGDAELELLDVPVREATLDSFNLAPRIIKIDVEGAELAALKGMRRTLVEHRPIVMCERNDNLQFVAWMNELGFRNYSYSPGHTRLWKFDGPVPGLNVFFLHPDRVPELQADGIEVT